MSVDSPQGPKALANAWRASGRQLSVVMGSSAALLSLLSDAPVHIASLRGALAWGATLAATSVGAWFAERTWAPRPIPTPTPAPGSEMDMGSDGPEA